jgi:CheY-like chemotaxis protein
MNDLDPKILVIDDLFVNRASTAQLLKQQNLSCTLASGAMEAYQLCKQTNFDFILLDINMPDISGIEAFDTLKQLCVNTFIFAYTTDKSDSLIEEINKKGFDGLIPKPFNPVAFKEIIHTHYTNNKLSNRSINYIMD